MLEGEGRTWKREVVMERRTAEFIDSERVPSGGEGTGNTNPG